MRRFPLGCAYVILVQLIASHLCLEPARDSSNVRTSEFSGDLQKRAVNRHSPLEEIFRGPKEEIHALSDGRDSVGSQGNTRTKRESASKSASQQKRSISKKSAAKLSGSSLRNAKDSDYRDSQSDQEASDFDEAEDAAPRGSANYRRSFPAGEDSGFTDQEERSSLYDDFEAKDVVKRGISGAEDYEEADGKDSQSALEETVAVQGEESLDEEAERGKSGESRVKRERSDKSSPIESVVIARIEPKDEAEAPSKRDAKEPEVQSKRNVERDEPKVNLEPLIVNDKSDLGNEQVEDKSDGANGKLDDVKLSNDKKVLAELSNTPDNTRIEGAKIIELDPNDLGPKIELIEQIGPDLSEAGSPSKAGEYEKRVEEEIQQKIDSIKDELQREIEEKQRIKEIEENNAKFDELRDQEDDEDQGVEGEVDKRRVSKRSPQVRSIDRSQRSTSRKKRQETQKIRSVDRKARSKPETLKKRAVEKASAKSPVKKREFARQVILVRNDRGAARKRRRSRNALVPEQAKINDGPDLTVNSNLRSDLADDKNEADQDVPGRKSDSVVAAREVGPRLATDYGEAFGGHQGEPGVALARFKRIKRVLRTAKS